ncbi:MAG: hypothetical protein ACU843_04405 [Gammaproteobacteria bacterium]
MRTKLIVFLLSLSFLIGNAHAEMLKIGKVVKSRYQTLDRFASIKTEFANDKFGAFIRTYLTEHDYPCPGGCEEISAPDVMVDLPFQGLSYEDLTHSADIDEHNNEVVGRYWLSRENGSGGAQKMLCAEVIHKRSFPLYFVKRKETINVNCHPEVRGDTAIFSVREDHFSFEKIPTLFISIVD